MGKVGQSAVVYLDANILIYLAEGAVEYQDAVEAQLRTLGAVSPRFITSELSLAEVLVHPLRTNNKALIAVYEELFASFVRSETVSREVLYLAAQLRADTPSQRMPDAIHVATATLAGAEVFLTGDQGIKNVPGTMALSVLQP